MKRKGFPSASRDVRTCSHVISKFISLWFTPLATEHLLPLAFEVLGIISFYFFPLTQGTAKLAFLETHAGEASKRLSKAPSPARLCQSCFLCQLCPAPFSAPPIPPPPIFNLTITPRSLPHLNTTCFFPPSAFIPFPLLMTTRSSKFIPIRKKQSFFLDLSLGNLPWISAELFSFLYTFLFYI